MIAEELLEKATLWAQTEPAVMALVLVGSWARGVNRPDSDIDLVILTDEKEKFLENPGCFADFAPVYRENVEYYGRCTSLRVFYENGPEVEFGFVDSKWADLPLDEGTQRVLSGGYRVLVDKVKAFEKLPL